MDEGTWGIRSVARGLARMNGSAAAQFFFYNFHTPHSFSWLFSQLVYFFYHTMGASGA